MGEIVTHVYDLAKSKEKGIKKVLKHLPPTLKLAFEPIHVLIGALGACYSIFKARKDPDHRKNYDKIYIVLREMYSYVPKEDYRYQTIFLKWAYGYYQKIHQESSLQEMIKAMDPKKDLFFNFENPPIPTQDDGKASILIDGKPQKPTPFNGQPFITDEGDDELPSLPRKKPPAPERPERQKPPPPKKKVESTNENATEQYFRGPLTSNATRRRKMVINNGIRTHKNFSYSNTKNRDQRMMNNNKRVQNRYYRTPTSNTVRGVRMIMEIQRNSGNSTHDINDEFWC